MNIGRLWRDQCKRQQAYNLLAPVYGRFTEGFDTLDLKQAKVLLDEPKVPKGQKVRAPGQAGAIQPVKVRRR